MSERPTDEELRRLLTKYGFQSDSSTVLAILDEKDTLRKRVAALEVALEAMIAHEVEYMTINHLGNAEEQSYVINARAALKDAPQ